MSIIARGLIVSTMIALAASALAAEPSYVGDPLDKDIMSEEIFMDAAWHFQIERVDATSEPMTVITTGGVFAFSPRADRVLCQQRLAKTRRSLLLYFPEGSLAGLHVTAQGTGAVILESAAGVQFKVNCDSLLMIRSRDDIALRGRVLVQPLQKYSHGANHLLMDAFGAVGLFPLEGAAPGDQSEVANEYTR